MDTLVATIEKGKPFFDKVARNKYLKAVRDGFISAMPIVIFSSIFLLIAYVPNIWGFTWPDNVQAMLMKPYSYSMGILALVVAATTAKHFTDSLNRDMPQNNQISFISTMIAALIGFLILSSDSISVQVSDTVTISGFDSAYLGTKGLITAFIAAFVTCGVYHFCISHHITIKMPKEVPPNISQAFLDLIPLGLSTIVFWLFDHFFRLAFGSNFAAAVIGAFQPLFSAAETYPGLALIYGAMAFFWFVGVHGPSIVEPAITAPALLYLSDNLASYQAGAHAAHALTPGLQYFVATLGGTGATLMITLMFAFLCKSKELKTVGRASSIPVLFGVNEPILFGAPLILNPVFFIPFILTPILNVWLFKFFVDVLGMNGFIYLLPWTTPGPLGIILGTGIAPLSFLFVALVLALDFVVYFPFMKVYDKQMCEAEAENAAEEKLNELAETESATEKAAEEAAEEAAIAEGGNALDGKKVLVLCAGGGTSGLLANALAKAGQERGINIISAAGSYGTHLDIMPDYDLVVLAPQVASYLPDLEKDAARMNVKVAACQGKQYIALTRDGDAALKFVADQLGKE